MAALYIFNPEHGYALANNDPHFMPPASAVKFALDCALFLQYLVPEDSIWPFTVLRRSMVYSKSIFS